MKRLLVSVSLFALLMGGCAENGKWSLAGGGDYETSHMRALFSPDPNGGVGIKVISDSVIPDETEVNVAVGPTVNFYVGDVIGSAADVVIPGAWNPLKDAPVRVYGTMSLLYETEQKTLLFTPGTEMHLMPEWQIHPIIWIDYVWTEGGSLTEDGIRTTFGAEYQFR